MYLYNSATHKKEEFKTHTPGHVEMYTCGPTVYHFAHIGNLRSYIMEDVLEKYLRFSDYSVNRVMNITDVGHLTSDADEGEDKMLVMAAMCYFVECGQMPGWCLAIVLLREFAVSGMRLVAVEQGRVIAAAWSGKVKTASTMVCLCLMLVFQSNLLNVVCIAVIVATTVYSGIEYFAKNLDVFKEAD